MRIILLIGVLFGIGVGQPVGAQAYTSEDRTRIIREVVNGGCTVPVAEVDALLGQTDLETAQRHRLWTLVALRNRGLMTETDGVLRLSDTLCTPDQTDVRSRVIDAFILSGCTASPGDIHNLMTSFGLLRTETYEAMVQMHGRFETHLDSTERGLVLADALCPAAVRNQVDRAMADMIARLDVAPGCRLPYADVRAGLRTLFPGDVMIFWAARRQMELPNGGLMIARFDNATNEATLYGFGCNSDELAAQLAPAGRNQALVEALQGFNCRYSRLDRDAILAAFGREEHEFELALELFRMTGRLTGPLAMVQDLDPIFCGPDHSVPESLREGVDPAQHAALLTMFRARNCAVSQQELASDGPEFGVVYQFDIASARSAMQAMIIADEVVQVGDRFVLDQALCRVEEAATAAVRAAFQSGNCVLSTRNIARLLPGSAEQGVVATLLSEGVITLRGGALTLADEVCRQP